MPALDLETGDKIKVACDCGFRARVGAQLAGKKVKCKECGAALRVPSGATPPPTPPVEKPAASSKKPPKLERSEKNVLLGGVMALWAIGSFLFAVNAIGGSSGGAYSGGILLGAVFAGLVLLPVGLRTAAFGLQRVHVAGQDGFHPSAKLVLGVLLLLGSVGMGLEAAAALPSSDDSRAAITLGVCAIVAVAGCAVAMNGVRSLQADATTPAD